MARNRSFYTKSDKSALHKYDMIHACVRGLYPPTHRTETQNGGLQIPQGG